MTQYRWGFQSRTNVTPFWQIPLGEKLHTYLGKGGLLCFSKPEDIEQCAWGLKLPRNPHKNISLALFHLHQGCGRKHFVDRTYVGGSGSLSLYPCLDRAEDNSFLRFASSEKERPKGACWTLWYFFFFWIKCYNWLQVVTIEWGNSRESLNLNAVA